MCGVSLWSLHHPVSVEGQQLNCTAYGSMLRRESTSAAMLSRRRDQRTVRREY